MACKICNHPKHGEMVIQYARNPSYRNVAKKYGVSFKSLQRHVNQCVYEVMEEAEEERYRKVFEYATVVLMVEYGRIRKTTYKSLVTKPIEWTWSRRSWGKNKETFKELKND